MKKRTIVKSTILISLFTIFIKLLGLIKQTLMASFCGASLSTDAFYISTGVIGQIIMILFASLSVTLLTMYNEEKAKSGDEKANKFINTVLNVLLPVSLICAFIFYFASPLVAKFLAPSYSPSELKILTDYIKIVSIAFVPWCYYLTLNVVLESNKIFLPGRFQGFFQNIFLIVAILFFFNSLGAVSLVYAFLFSGVAEAVLITIIARKEIKLTFKNNFDKEKLKKLLILSVPLIIGNATSEINDIIDKQIATGIGVGTTSLLTYSGTLNEIITGVVLSSISIVLFSHFSTWVSENKIDLLKNNLVKYITVIIFFILPVMVIFITNGDNIISLIYGHGSLSTGDLEKIYVMLIGYVLGFIFQATRNIFAKALYALQDTKTPMYNGIICVVINATLSIWLSKYFGVIGITISTSIAMVIGTIILYIALKKKIPGFSFYKEKNEYFKLLFASTITLIILFVCKQYVVANNFINLFVSAFICIICYILILILLHSKNISYIFSLLKSKLYKTKNKNI